MVERYGLSIPTKIKEEYAKCITEIFPALRDPFGDKGYVSTYTGCLHGDRPLNISARKAI